MFGLWNSEFSLVIVNSLCFWRCILPVKLDLGKGGKSSEGKLFSARCLYFNTERKYPSSGSITNGAVTRRLNHHRSEGLSAQVQRKFAGKLFPVVLAIWQF